jgi:hypothetical protein
MAEPFETDLIEYKIRLATRYVVTRFERRGLPGNPDASMSSVCGEFDNSGAAYQVAYALAKVDHERMGWPIADERIQYPRHPDEGNATPVVI